MKKYILILLLFTGFISAQTLPNAQYNTVTTNTLKIKTPTTVTSVNFLSTNEADGSVSKIAPINVNIPYTPVNYSAPTQTIGNHLLGIDTRLGQISSTSAGLTQRVWFTADNTTVTAGTFFASNPLGKGTAPAPSPALTLSLGDNAKGYFNKDLISGAQPIATIGYAGTYSGNLTVSATPTPNATQQRFTLEVYRCNNGGTPIASGVSGAPVGDLGVTVLAILDSGLVNLVAGSISNVSISGTLTQNITINTGERLRYHVSAQKVGTGGGNVTFGVYYGSSYNSYYDVPVAITTDAVLNKSAVTGVTDTDALNTLNTLKSNDANVIHKTGAEIKNGALNISTSGGVAPLAPIHIGNRNVINSVNAQSLVAGNYNNSVSGNGHAFSDGSNLSKTGLWAYASYDARVDITGTGVAADHYVGFQHAPVYNFSGSISKNWGLYTTTIISAGTIDNNYGAYFANPAKSGTGAIGVNYGLYIENQTSGSSNYSIYSAGGRNYLGGDLVVVGTVNANSQGANIRFKFDGSGNDGAVIAGGDGSLYLGNWSLSKGLKITPLGGYELLGVGALKIPNLAGTGEAITLVDAGGNLKRGDAVISGVKRYKALISQTGTSAPTVIVLENSLGTITYGYSSVGGYTISSSALFTVGKTYWNVQSGPNANTTSAINQATSSSMILWTTQVSTGANINAGLNSTPILIEVYP